MNKKVKELLIYILGMLILGLGLSLSTKFNLGTSAVTALPFSVSEIYNLSFGDMTLIYYIIFIVAQIIIHIATKKYKDIIGDILQLLVSVIFTRYLNLTKALIPSLESLNIFVRIILYLIPVIFVGVGAAITVKTSLPLNPPDGFVKLVAVTSKKEVGLIKNIVDITIVVVTCIFSYIASGKIVGVGLGTLIAMLGVGRVIALFNKTIGKKINL